MENRVIKRGMVEMSVVCSDLSLLDNINMLLSQKGVISVEDEDGVLHYIVDGRSNRREVAGKISSITSGDPSGSSAKALKALASMLVSSMLNTTASAKILRSVSLFFEYIMVRSFGS